MKKTALNVVGKFTVMWNFYFIILFIKYGNKIILTLSINILLYVVHLYINGGYYSWGEYP